MPLTRADYSAETNSLVLTLKSTVSFLYQEPQKHPEWIRYGDFIYYADGVDRDSVENLFAKHFKP